MASSGHSPFSMMPVAAPDLPPREPVRIGLPERVSPTFEALYREHFRFVWRSVRRLGIDPTLVDDLVQETFLVVHRRLGDFEGRSTTKTWLYGIVRRVVADHRRTQRRKPALRGPSADLEALSDTLRPGPDASAEQAEKVRLFYLLLERLDDDKREVFVLADLEGMTLAEIAESIGVNANTVFSRLRAARQKFEEALIAQAARERSAP
jgi:RNA polymerase sigma-70 factor (ECF subfamily)